MLACRAAASPSTVIASLQGTSRGSGCQGRDSRLHLVPGARMELLQIQEVIR